MNHFSPFLLAWVLAALAACHMVWELVSVNKIDHAAERVLYIVTDDDGIQFDDTHMLLGILTAFQVSFLIC